MDPADVPLLGKLEGSGIPFNSAGMLEILSTVPWTCDRLAVTPRDRLAVYNRTVERIPKDGTFGGRHLEQSNFVEYKLGDDAAAKVRADAANARKARAALVRVRNEIKKRRERYGFNDGDSDMRVLFGNPPAVMQAEEAARGDDEDAGGDGSFNICTWRFPERPGKFDEQVEPPTPPLRAWHGRNLQKHLLKKLRLHFEVRGFDLTVTLDRASINLCEPADSRKCGAVDLNGRLSEELADYPLCLNCKRLIELGTEAAIIKALGGVLHQGFMDSVILGFSSNDLELW
jgi:hypothetical protein